MSDTPSWDATVLLSKSEFGGQADGHAVSETNALVVGAQVDEFEIIRVLGVGGFGIVYLALDRVLLRYVAIKEYFPTSLAERRAGRVVVRSSSQAETFSLGLESFFNEARMLAKFDHPSLVKVFRFWKASGTAYMAMQYYAGTTLKDVREAMTSAPDEPWLRALLDPLLGALEVLHLDGVYHRDISPDNILILPDGRPVLLDFGSARRVIGDHTQTLTAILKPNFAPIEQYADDDGMKQGAWTDLYALGATLEFALTGKTPKPAVMRAIKDDAPGLCSVGFSNVSAEFLATVDWMLALTPEERPQSVACLQLALGGEFAPPSRTPRDAIQLGVISPLPAIDRAGLDQVSVAGQTSGLTSESASGISATYEVNPDGGVPSATVGMRSRQSLATRAAWVVLAIGTLFGLVSLFARQPAPASVEVPALSAPKEADRAAVAPTVAEQVVLPMPGSPEGSAPAPTEVTAEPVSTPSVKLEAPPRSARAHSISRPATDKAAMAKTAINPPSQPASTTQPGSTPVVSAPTTRAVRPDEACASSNFLVRAACIRRECQRPGSHADPQCVEARALDEAQMQRRSGQF